VEVNGFQLWDIQVTDRRFYARTLRDKSLVHLDCSSSSGPLIMYSGREHR
jgi:hypothetical protein